MKFLLVFVLIFVFGLISHIHILQGDNLFFTVDQGRDAVYAREIVNSNTIFLRGPETSVRGLFTGPLWYYFIAIGYFIFGGNPFGSVFVLIVLNLVVSIILVWQIKKHVNQNLALIVGFGLQISWPFFVTSLYGFNPFPLVSISILLIMLLAKSLNTKTTKYYAIALILILLAFNTELAGAIVFLLFYILIGFYLVLYKKLSRKTFFVFALVTPLFGLVKITIDFLRQDKASTNSGLQVFSTTNFIETGKEFVEIIGSIIPQQTIVGFVLVILIAIMYLKTKHKNIFSKKFVYLSLTLIFVSFLFFGSNMGMREWHTIYVSPLIFISTLLMAWEIKRLRYLIIGSIFIFQFLIFKQNYTDYLKPTNNPGLLYNQKKVLDYIYTNNEENGFNLYTYTHTFYDYNYQYLISWYARPKYGFYPCEYSNYPLSHKYLYIPGNEKYREPKLGCDKLRFLIIESDTNGNENKDWINHFKNLTIFVEETRIGNTTIEKRKTPDIIK